MLKLQAFEVFFEKVINRYCVCYSQLIHRQKNVLKHMCF